MNTKDKLEIIKQRLIIKIKYENNIDILEDVEAYLIALKKSERFN